LQESLLLLLLPADAKPAMSSLLNPALQAPHRRSSSFGGTGFSLPGDPTDLLRSDLVISKVCFFKSPKHVFCNQEKPKDLLTSKVHCVTGTAARHCSQMLLCACLCRSRQQLPAC